MFDKYCKGREIHQHLDTPVVLYRAGSGGGDGADPGVYSGNAGAKWVSVHSQN